MALVWHLLIVAAIVVKALVESVKVFASGWGGEVEAAWWRNFTFEEMEAIVDEAHAHRLKVAAHTSSPEAIKLSLKAGVDTIEHLVDIDDECIDLFCQKGAYLVPTLGCFSEKSLERRIRNNHKVDFQHNLLERNASGKAIPVPQSGFHSTYMRRVSRTCHLIESSLSPDVSQKYMCLGH